MKIPRVLGYYGLTVCLAQFCLKTGIQKIPCCAKDAEDDREPVGNYTGPSPSGVMPPAQQPPSPEEASADRPLAPNGSLNAAVDDWGNEAGNEGRVHQVSRVVWMCN
ncbi:hypothetical protein LZ554_006117 [Drepanopeziza brunnea f. sp. 'monogermtubi']|nr:hypothetical protein LZ554_006117 [Drepanopeziza brunnea f. sp. 'monogermtubi']